MIDAAADASLLRPLVLGVAWTEQAFCVARISSKQMPVRDGHVTFLQRQRQHHLWLILGQVKSLLEYKKKKTRDTITNKQTT